MNTFKTGDKVRCIKKDIGFTGRDWTAEAGVEVGKIYTVDCLVKTDADIDHITVCEGSNSAGWWLESACFELVYRKDYNLASPTFNSGTEYGKSDIKWKDEVHYTGLESAYDEKEVPWNDEVSATSIRLAEEGITAFTVEPKQAKRYNEGKPPMSYMLYWPLAWRELAHVCANGEEKYAKFNYKKGAPVLQYMDSALRHMELFANSEDFDLESHRHHLAHAAWNMLQALEVMLSPDKSKFDNRYKAE